MNKYYSVFKTGLKQEKDAVFDAFMRCIIYFLIMYIMIELWKYIYGDAGTGQIINGYSLNQMLWYLIISECLVNAVRAQQITRTISNEVKSGSIAYKLNKPYNYYLYSISHFMAKSCFLILFVVPTAFIIGAIFVGAPEGFTFVQILPCIFSFLMSVFISWSIYGIVGLLAFWLQDSTPFYWIVSKMFMLLGMFFPVEFFPTWLQPVIEYSPIYSVMTGPSSLVAKFSWELFAKVAISQVSWSIIIILIGLFVYKLGKRRVVSNGG